MNTDFFGRVAGVVHEALALLKPTAGDPDAAPHEQFEKSGSRLYVEASLGVAAGARSYDHTPGWPWLSAVGFALAEKSCATLHWGASSLPPASSAPMSHPDPFGRATPRWSVPAQLTSLVRI